MGGITFGISEVSPIHGRVTCMYLSGTFLSGVATYEETEGHSYRFFTLGC